MRKEQYAVLLGGLIVACLLFYFGKTTTVTEKSEVASSTQLDFGDYESLQLSTIPPEDADRIRQLKSDLALSPDAETYLELSTTWQEIGNYPLGAFYYREAVNINEDSLSWEVAGDRFFEAWATYGDSLIINNLITFAVASYARAAKAENGGLDLKMKLANAYVESPDPMKGILILREIADSIPDYVPAQMRLGRLSLQTGQYEKALDRFQQVLKTEPLNTEALYFLALSNEGLGNTDETVRLLELCKQLVDNPEFSREIDRYIKDLKE